MDLGLADRSFVVTGGTSGIGLETARLLLAEGARVTICGRDRDRLDRAMSQLPPGRITGSEVDVHDAGQARALIDSSLQRWGRLDGIAAVAGQGLHGTLLDLEPQAVADEVANKLLAVLNVVHPARSALGEHNGAIVTLSAPTAIRPDTSMGAVSAARAAVANATISLARELAAEYIRVNAVSVGLIDTPRQQRRHELAGVATDYADWLQREAERREVPLGRPGAATEVAAAICWLLSPRSSYTTGAVLDVHG